MGCCLVNMIKRILVKKLSWLENCVEKTLSLNFTANIRFKLLVLLENIGAMLKETHTLPNGYKKYPNFAESYYNYKSEYKMLLQQACLVSIF